MTERKIGFPIWIAIVEIVVISGISLLASQSVSARSMTDESPILYDSHGKPVDHLVVGQQTTFSKTIFNEKDVPQPFLFLFEIRDDREFTHYVAFQNSTLPAKSQVDIGASWMAEAAGKYKLRTLLQTQFINPPPGGGILLYEHELIVLESIPQLPEEGQQPLYVNITVDGLKPVYKINQTLEFSVIVEGYGIDCLDFQAALSKTDANNNSTQPLRSWAVIAGCVDNAQLRNFAHSFSIGSGTFAQAMILNETGNYKVTIEYRGYTTEKYFSVTANDEVKCKQFSLCTYELKVGNNTYPINFRMNGTIENMTADVETQTLTIQLKVETSTSLQIAVPREVVDSRAGSDARSGPDEDFVVFIDEVPAEIDEIPIQAREWTRVLGISDNSEKYRMLIILLEEDSERVDIVGTWPI